MVIFPLLFYLICFSLLTFPLLFNFSSHFFADKIDGLQNIWNIWWTNKAITELHQSPWHTTYLHYPYGTTLLGHTLNPFNGFIGILLLKFLTLTKTYNFVVVFSFITGGLTSFFLAYYFTRSYWSSIAAGYIFTFSNFHFAHAVGHLNLTSLEWIPLFVLSWFMLLSKPRILTALFSSLALFLVILCDYYYFFYCCLTALIVFSWFCIQKRNNFYYLFRKNYLKPLFAFFALFLITSGVLILAFYISNLRDPFVGAHKAEKYSLDLLAPFIPGGFWRFAYLTKFFWSRLPGNISESSVHIGLGVCGIIIYVWIKRAVIKDKTLNLWFFLMLFFIILALGPKLHIFGKVIPFKILPYTILTEIIPIIKLSGVPVRMMVMVILAASILCAYGFKLLITHRKYFIVTILLFIIVVEYLPAPLPQLKIHTPPYVEYLKKLPGEKGVFDWRNKSSMALYFQTIHEKPIGFGYISRWTRKLKRNKKIIKNLVKNGRYDVLRDDYHFQYVMTAPDISIESEGFTPEIIYLDNQAKIYSLSE